jgi:hypothetical protein
MHCLSVVPGRNFELTHYRIASLSRSAGKTIIGEMIHELCHCVDPLPARRTSRNDDAFAASIGVVKMA